jgi:myo-inositol-1(or 4)-monophosphatase
MNLTQIEDTVIQIAHEAGARLRHNYRQAKEINRKSSAIDIVTQYDLETEALITDRLRATFPEHRLLAEEGDYDSSNRLGLCWYVDPIDGTNNFTHGFPVFAVSMALYDGEQPLVGVVYDPLRDECFHAARGQGAFLSHGGNREALAVSRRENLVDCLLATGFPYDRHTSELDNLAQFAAFLKRARGIRRAGAAALDVAYVAAGRLDGYWEFKLGSWDIAAGVLLVTEAGGQVTGSRGEPFSLTASDKLALVASNGHIHHRMLQVLQDVFESQGLKE